MWARRSLLSSLAVMLVLVGCTEPTSIVIEPLRVINWSPASGAFCVDVGATVSATFSDDLVQSSLTAESFQLLNSDGPVAATLEYDPVTYTARLRPTATLEFDRLYSVVATTAIQGKQRGRLGVQLDASFMTIARSGCVPGDVECTWPSDCPGSQICSSISTCVDECVLPKDCYRGTCTNGACVPIVEPDGGGGDPGPGDPGPGDPAAGDPGPGDPVAGDPVAGDPVAGDPVAGDPVAGDPVAGDPVAGDPVAGDPVAGDPVAGDVDPGDTDLGDSAPGDGAGD